MPDNPDQPDDVDVLLRNYAASRRTFAANTPDLHEVDVRMLAETARRERTQRAGPADIYERLRGFFAALSTPQWSALGATAVLLLFFAVWLPLRAPGGGGQGKNLTSTKPPASSSQLFAMVATTFRGESETLQDDFRQFDLDLNLDRHQLTLKFTNGSVLTGTLEPDDAGKPSAGAPPSFVVNASGSDAQNQPIAFKGALVAVPDPAAPSRAKQVSLRGMLTANHREIQFTAGMK